MGSAPIDLLRTSKETKRTELMCLIIFAHQHSPDYPLVVAANRDEFFPRPTQDADFWTADAGPQQILAGKDLQAGGTWLGINREGRFAAVTNIRDPSQPEQKPRSRGELPISFLSGQETPEIFCEGLAQHFDEYAGFNLLIGDHESMYYVNNFEKLVQKLQPGIYGLSNGMLNSAWPKVTRGREQLDKLLESPATLATDALIAMMGNREEASHDELPDTGVPLEMEIKLSPAFIHNTDRNYGTRCSTAVIMEASGRVRFNERNFDPQGNGTSNHFFEFVR